MSKIHFATNLRLVCNQYRSVAHVCRSLEINRQQFNKYLSGKIHPSKHNLIRLCEFFKISKEQFNLHPDDFSAVVIEAPKPEPGASGSMVETLINSLPSSVETLSRYEGYYYSYAHALGFPGQMIRSLVRIYRVNNQFYTRGTDHLWDKGETNPHRQRFKYQGIALYLGDRIFITELETLTKSAVCHTILFPSYRNIVVSLSGITMGVGSINSHMPKATRVEYQFLGKQVDIKEALRGCGLFDLDSGLIDSNIRKRIDNDMTDQEFLLTARDF